MSTVTNAAAMAGDLVQLRRDLHRTPELGLELPATQAQVLAALDGLPLEISTGRELTSVVAVLRGGAGTDSTARPSVLLRADMDALPVREHTGVDYAATGDFMHACGHDLHTTMLVGAAHLLAAQQDHLRGDVVLMFQPGEEGAGGADRMIEEGVLDAAGRRVDAAYALQVTSAMLPAGLFAARPGPLMAAVGTLTVRVLGAGGHGSAPHPARDPIPATCEMVTALQAFVTRSFDVFDPVVLTVGMIRGGTASNLIPDNAEFSATVRAFSPGSLRQVFTGAERVVRGIASSHGLDVEVATDELFPVTVNDPNKFATIASVVQDTPSDPNAGSSSPTPSPAQKTSRGSWTRHPVPWSSWAPHRTAPTRQTHPSTTLPKRYSTTRSSATGPHSTPHWRCTILPNAACGKPSLARGQASSPPWG